MPPSDNGVEALTCSEGGFSVTKIYGASHWRKFRREYLVRDEPTDFDEAREQAVYINLGVRPSGGYAVKVVSVYEEDKRLVLMKYGVHIVFAIFACSAPMAAEATAQFSDQIVIDGRTEQLFTEPLQDAFRADPELQQNLMSRISENRCTAARRGYVATWEIRANELYLVTVQVDPCSGHTWVPLEELFPGATGTVKATWFSGMLTVPQGNQIEYMHMEYESRYERYLFLDIDKGNVTSSTLTSGPPNQGSPAR